MPCRRRAAVKGRSFPIPEPVAELGGQFELFGGYGATELLAKLAGVVLPGRFPLPGTLAARADRVLTLSEGVLAPAAGYGAETVPG